jgi:hypothetical protein
MKKVFFPYGMMLWHMYMKRHQLEHFRNTDMFGNEFPDITKDMEGVINDIHQNLVEWSTDKVSVFYKTKNRWYMFSPSTEHNGLWEISVFSLSAWERTDTWANKSTIMFLGKEWLTKQPQRSKYVQLLN